MIFVSGSGLSRREALVAFSAAAALGSFGFPTMAMAASRRASKTTEEQIEAFFEKFPETVKPFIVNHMKTDIGKDDVSAFIQSGCEVRIETSLHIRVFGDLPNSMAESEMAFWSRDGDLPVLFINDDFIKTLDVNKSLDFSRFSACLSNEASHAIQQNYDVFDFARYIACVETPEIAVNIHLAQEIASDMRMFRHIIAMQKSNMITSDEARDLLSNNAGINADIYQAISSAKYASDDAKILAGMRLLWDPRGPYSDRVKHYYDESVEGAKSFCQFKKINGLTEEDKIRDAKFSNNKKAADDVLRGLDESSTTKGFHKLVATIIDPIVSAYSELPIILPPIPVTKSEARASITP